ncbi:MAG: hypothetical protein ABIK89_18215, partial [Planctomycetota bacterium]
MRAVISMLVLVMGAAWVPSARAELSAVQQNGRVLIEGDHFRIHVDSAKGGQITELRLFDGTNWNRVLGGDGQVCPMVELHSGDTEYQLVHDSRARIEQFHATPELIRFQVAAVPRTADGEASPWGVRLTYEICAEGAVFVGLDYSLPEGQAELTGARLSLVLDRAATQCAKYREVVFRSIGKSFESARLALGTNPERSFTNEIQAIVERNTPMVGKSAFEHVPGRFTWSLAEGAATLRGPYQYHNRFALGLGAAATGFAKSNVVGQRVYHWINYLDRTARAEWYPTDEQIDKMAAHGGTMLILHNDWMRQGGSNGRPHADYRVVRDEGALRRTIDYAHRKGMRFGLYKRGIERYALDAAFFEEYCKRDWDGLYVDWHGPHCVAYHEHRYQPETAFADTHYSEDGSYLPAREYFFHTKKLRELVGREGFLIGHQGFGAGGLLANLAFDGYLPGEAGADHGMFSDRDNAVFLGMMGGGPCMPWTLDSPAFTQPEGVAKMAAWGFYPHVGLGLQRRKDATLFTL